MAQCKSDQSLKQTVSLSLHNYDIGFIVLDSYVV